MLVRNGLALNWQQYWAGQAPGVAPSIAGAYVISRRRGPISSRRNQGGSRELPAVSQ
jgi:hypothetical protein